MDVWSDHWDQFQAGSRAFAKMRSVALDVAPFVDDPEALEQYARRKQLTVNEVIYYFNTFEYGGDEGLEAIRNPDILPEDLAGRLSAKLTKLSSSPVPQLTVLPTKAPPSACIKS